LDTIAVKADSGFMGGSESAEFMVVSDSGEDTIAICSACGYKSSLAMASCEAGERPSSIQHQASSIKEVDTPGVSTIDKVAEFLKCKPEQMIKTLIYIADSKPVAVLVRGDHDVNEAKLARSVSAKTLTLADEETIKKITGGPLGFSGPCGLKGMDIIVDHAVAKIEDGVTGANKQDKHLVHVVPGRDFDIKETKDIRYITEGDLCPKCKIRIGLKKTMEAGHVFKLGTKYSESMKARFLDSDGKEKPFIMGCYGIGVNRIVAAAIEQNNDKDGIIWPLSIAPYKVIIISITKKDDKDVIEASEDLYKQLSDSGIETLLDDREISPGIKFKDADLIGIPLQVVIGPKKMKDSLVEIKIRATGEKQDVAIKDAKEKITELIK